ncbi:hypothetical protein M446_3806 [Methylobacterium sp. 4-46]|uniref:hypothetical protein n=1 Tax=unclassified Methylobacterium TaxID=2615210 RepID=UPI000165C9E1|nr:MULTISPECIES: hypothetical protein [Methylobacterium]ACA18183.1 hypothetical protein M446_3806 [Methylobacterium sp. 4-46]WFT77479.1 hypothetical protein QA634_19300 [Methylobacterium nodulans]
MMDDHPLIWRPARPGEAADFFAEVDGHTFARVCKVIRMPSWTPQWAWSILLRQPASVLGFDKSGTAPTKGQAVAAVRERWLLAREWSAWMGEPPIAERDVARAGIASHL